MYKLIRIFNQNKKQILIAILAIVFVIAVIQLLNNYYKEQREEKIQNMLNKKNEINTSTYNPSYSVASGRTINESINKQANNVIDTFIKKCNEGKIEDAYNMLSKDCKEEIYPNIEKFKVYYKQNFNTKKDYTTQLWVASSLTYKVQLKEDAISTGKIENNTVFEDFYTIVNENGESKLNISEYIGKNNINISETRNGITINVNYKKIFKDYEIYNITVENNSQNDIMLDSKESTQTLYLKANDGKKYVSSLYEIDKNSLIINKKYKSTYSIQFFKQYGSNVTDESIVFSDIIINSKEYEEKENKKQYQDRITIEVNI